MNNFSETSQEQIIFALVIMRMLYINNEIWYKSEEVRAQTIRYYSKTRNISHHVKRKRRVLACCKNCRIYFLTSPSNRGRKDLRCPFGCRKIHKREASKNRVKSYRKTNKGKKTKQDLNKNRYLLSKKHKKKAVEKKCMEAEKTGSFMGYLRFITSLIEGRFISWQEIKNILLGYFKKWRQHPLEYWLRLCNMTT